MGKGKGKEGPQNALTATRARVMKHQNKTGIFSQKLFGTICSRIAGGESLLNICKDKDMPSRESFYSWVASSDDLRKQYDQATTLRSDHYAEEILAIADDASDDELFVETTDGNGAGAKRVCNNEFVQRSKLRIDARKWLLAKLTPKKYGDRIGIEMDVSDKLADKLAAARQRLTDGN
jgi:hypothetical protein